jgi:hypothetical protein
LKVGSGAINLGAKAEFGPARVMRRLMFSISFLNLLGVTV